MKISMKRSQDAEYLMIKYSPAEQEAFRHLFEDELHLNRSRSESAFGGGNTVDYYQQRGTELLSIARAKANEPHKIKAVDAINSPLVVTSHTPEERGVDPHTHRGGDPYTPSKINIAILRVIPNRNGEVMIKVDSRNAIDKLDYSRLAPSLRNTFEALFQKEYDVEINITEKRLMA